MRLLETTDVTFKEFVGSAIPEYVIISHRWCDDEVSYQDFLERRLAFLKRQTENYGWTKIQLACEIAKRRGFRWVWIDTCCIDKKSSAELSEAINSMFSWYQRSSECYVFLPDVGQPSPESCAKSLHSTTPAAFGEPSIYPYAVLAKSTWFTRVWTLQELLAPRFVEFFDAGFRYIGNKHHLQDTISRITNISVRYLKDPTLMFRGASVGTRMMWASKREATRMEDAAYALLGIFGINMALLYGERERAFHRLQFEILRRSTDESIFMWHSIRERNWAMNLLAPDLGSFETTKSTRTRILVPREHYEVTNKGVRICLYLPTDRVQSLSNGSQCTVLVPLNLYVMAAITDTWSPTEIPCVRATLRMPLISTERDTQLPHIQYLEGTRLNVVMVQVDNIDLENLKEKSLSIQERPDCDFDIFALGPAAGYQVIPVYFPFDWQAFDV